MGNVFKRMKVDRSEIVVTTKIIFGHPFDKIYPNQIGLCRKHVIEGLKRSLKNLQLDYVDVVFAHKPDIHTPMEEIVRSFNYVIDQGMAMYWGTSDFTPEQLRHAIISFLVNNIIELLIYL